MSEEKKSDDRAVVLYGLIAFGMSLAFIFGVLWLFFG